MRTLTILCGCVSQAVLPTQGEEPGCPAGSDLPCITIENVPYDPQQETRVNITLTSGGQTITAIQFDVSYESDATTWSVAPGSSANSAGKVVWTAPLDSSTGRILIAGPNHTAIPDGVIAILSVQRQPEAPPGFHPLLVANAVASDLNGDGRIVLPNPGGVTLPGTGMASPLILAVANAASYARGPVSPGEIIVIGGVRLGEPGLTNLSQPAANGSLPTAIAGTRVFFDGIPAPLLYVTEGLVSAIAPYSVEGRLQTSLRVEWQGDPSSAFLLAVTRAAPGVFTLDQSGVGQGAILNEDGSLNGLNNPAPRGSVVSIYGTGEGQTAPPGTDGSIVNSARLRRPLLPVKAFIGGHDAEVLYAGSAGDQVAGLLQVSVRVPGAAAPGPAVPLALSAGPFSTQFGVTLAVQ